MDRILPYKENDSKKLFRRLIMPGFKLSFHGIADWYLFSLFVLPTYFGIRLIFFDLTAFRLFEVLLLWCILKSSTRKNQFIKLVKSCPNNIWIGIYLFIVIYTNLIHPSLNTIMYWLTNGVFVIFCVAYLVIYEYGVERFLDKIKIYIWIICTLSPIQVITGQSPFALLDTLGKVVTTSRFGEIRVMGNCTVANGYAMYLMILFPIMCCDWNARKIDFKKNGILLLLMVLNIFLTGSRLTIGTMILGVFLCFIMQNRRELKQSLGFILIGIPIMMLFLYYFKDLDFVKGLLRTFFSAFDEIFDTSYALQYGADAQTLYNSSYYRELLVKNTIFGDWLNPWLGKGGNYKLNMFIQGYYIHSCDNYYVGQYITYAWPGLIVWLMMSGSFFVSCIKKWILERNVLVWCIIVSIICYFISLWYLDQLQTFPIMMSMFGLSYAILKEKMEYDT